MPRNLFTGEEIGPARGDSGFRINPRREAGVVDRFLGSLPVTGEGEANVYRERFGAENVVVEPGGRIFIRDPETKEFFPADRSGITAGDVADFGGPAVNAAAALVVPEIGLPASAARAAPVLSRIVGSALSGGAQGAVGAGARLGAGASAPGEQAASGGDAARMAAMDALLGAATGGTLRSGLEGFDRLRPSNFRARYIRGREGEAETSRVAAGEPPLAEQETVAGAGGFTPGQATGDKGLLTIEGMLRRNPFSANIVQRSDEAQLRAARDRIASFMTRLDQNPADAEDLGRRAIAGVEGFTDQVVRKRAADARVDFSFLDEAAGGQRIIQPTRVASVLDEEIQKAATPGGGGAAERRAAELVKIRRGLTVTDEAGNETIRPLSGQEFQNLLETYGRASAGKGSLFNELDKAADQRVAKRLFRELQGDLDDAVAQAGDSTPVAEALKRARDNYHANSAPLDDLRATALGRLVGDARVPPAPEDVAAKLARYESSQLRASLDVVQRFDPDFGQAVKRRLLEDAFERSRPTGDRAVAAVSGGQDLPEFSPAKLFTNLRESPVFGVLSREERYEANVIFNGLKRLARREGEGSPTAPLLAAWEAIKSFGGLLSSPVAAAQTLTGIFTARGLATAMVTPEGRASLREIVSTGPRTEKSVRALTFLSQQATSDQPAPATPPNAELDEAKLRAAISRLGVR